ncbi:helix-turn-helix domain-containing protein [Streptomyces melanosporofaciens]
MEAESAQGAGQAAEAVFIRQMKRRRTRLGLSQSELADRVAELGGNLYQQTIAKIEAGKRAVRLSEADTLAHALGVTVAEMLTDIGDDQEESHPRLVALHARLEQDLYRLEAELNETQRARDAATSKAVTLEAKRKEIKDQLAATREAVKRTHPVGGPRSLPQFKEGDRDVNASTLQTYKAITELRAAVREAREAAGLTLDDMREETGLSVEVLEEMEQGRKSIHMDSRTAPEWITKMARAAGIDPDPLLAKYRGLYSTDEEAGQAAWQEITPD